MLTLAATLAVALSAAPASGLDAVLARAAAAYAEAEFDAALTELDRADALATTRAQQVTVLLYRGVVLANVPNPDGANAAFGRALALDAEAKLPLQVTPKVQAEFDRMQVAARSMRAAMLASDVPREVKLAPEPPPTLEAARPRPTVPVAPFVFAGAAVAAAATGVAFGALSAGSVQQARASVWAMDKAYLRDQAQTQATVANVAYGVAGAAVLTAVVTWAVLSR